MDENKDESKKRIVRRTTSVQFEKLVDLLEDYPHLAAPFPNNQLGHPKEKLEDDWKYIALSLNAIGPPTRTMPEWKKTWSDLRSRTKQNIAEINKCDLYLTEGRSKPLNPLEFRVAKLCNLLSNPSPVNINKPVNRVTPNISSNLPPTIIETSSPSPKTPASETVQKVVKKRKISKQKRQAYAKDIELLRKQVTIQEAIADAMESQVKAAEEHNKSLNNIAEACKLIASSMSDFIKQLK